MFSNSSQKQSELDEKLFEALKRNELDIIKTLLSQGANINALDIYKRTPLYIAAKQGNTEAVKLFLAEKASIDTIEDLHHKKEIIKSTLKQTINFDQAYNRKRTPLHIAVKKGHKKIVQLLLEHNAKVDTVNEHGRTPLFNAVSIDNKEIAELLLNYGAKVDAVDDHGKTPLYCTCESKNIGMAKFLLEQGAVVSPKHRQWLKKLELFSYLENRFEQAIATIQAKQETKISLVGNWLSAEQMTQLVEALKHNHIVDTVELGRHFEKATIQERIWLDERFFCSTGMREAINYAKACQKEELQKLLQQNAWLRSVRYMPLHIAVLANSEALCCLLLSDNHSLRHPDVLGRTPLNLAKERGQEEFAKNLKRLAKEITFTKLLEEQPNIVTSAKAFDKEAKKLREILETMSILDPTPEEPLGFLLHRFWRAANNAEHSIKLACFKLQPYLLYPEQLLKKEGHSTPKKIRASLGVVGINPSFLNIRGTIKKIDSVYSKIVKNNSNVETLLEILIHIKNVYVNWMQKHTDYINVLNEFVLPVWMVGIGIQRRLLKNKAADILRPVSFRQESDAEEGTSVIKIWNGVHFKQSPHAPGIEFMVASLSNLVAGRTVTPTELIKIIGADGLHTVYQASKTVDGITLQELINSHPEYLQKIDSQNFSAMIFTSLLTDPQDGKPDNYKVELYVAPDKSVQRIEIISIDNDIAFVDPIVCKHDANKKEEYEDKEKSEEKQKGKYFVNVKNVLYFFPQMDQPVDISFRDHFLTVYPEFILTRWLKMLKKQNQHYQLLINSNAFSLEEFEGGISQKRGLQLPIKLVEGTVRKIYYKLIKLRTYLQEHPNATHNDLFACVENGIYLYYQSTKANHTEGDIISCIKTLYEESISSIQDLRYFQQEFSKGNTGYMTQQVLRTADEFGFEDKRHQPICGTGVDAISELVAAIHYERFDEENRNNLYKCLAILQPQAIQVFHALLKNPISDEGCLTYIIDHLQLDPHALQAGGYLLHQAVAHKRVDVVVLLLDRYKVNIHVHSQTDRNRTALHMAAAHWDIATIRALLNRGADRNAKDQQGKTPLEVVRPEIQMTSGIEQTATSPTREQVLSLLQSPNPSAAVPVISNTTLGFFSKPSISDSSKEQSEEKSVSFTSSP